MLTTEFSERVTQQGLWYKTTPMSCELEIATVDMSDESATGSDSLCTT